MDEREFEEIAAAEWDRVPDRFSREVKNVALLIEDEPSDAVREAEDLHEGETLLGLYQGIPLSERGSEYGISAVLPDTITLYRLPILDEACEMDRAFRDAVRIVIRETIWHELGHYFGFPEEPLNERESEGTNRFDP